MSLPAPAGFPGLAPHHPLKGRRDVDNKTAALPQLSLSKDKIRVLLLEGSTTVPCR